VTSGRRPSSASLVLAGLAVVLVVIVAGPPGPVLGAQEPAGPAPGSTEPRRLVVVTDSVAAGAGEPLGAALEDRGWDVTVDAVGSRTTLSGADAVASFGGGSVDTLVISLGANDGGNPETFRTRVDAVLDRASDVRRVYWLTIHEVREYYVAANEILRDASERAPSLTILDWNALASDRPELTAPGGLHLTGAGVEAMTQLVTDAVTADRAAVPDPAVASSVIDVAEDVAAGPEPTTVRPAPGDATTSSGGAALGPGSGPASPVTTTTPPEPGSAWRSVAGWTVGGFLLVVGSIVGAGTWLAFWALWSSRRSPSPPAQRSETHPAVRAKLRAERIAAARRAADEQASELA
jgi:hypothetical protein